eukprot:8255933-Ditylum_brightwellii.AAC.1
MDNITINHDTKTSKFVYQFKLSKLAPLDESSALHHAQAISSNERAIGDDTFEIETHYRKWYEFSRAAEVLRISESELSCQMRNGNVGLCMDKGRKIYAPDPYRALIFVYVVKEGQEASQTKLKWFQWTELCIGVGKFKLRLCDKNGDNSPSYNLKHWGYIHGA